MGWLAGWSKRKPITLTGGSDGAQTDFQLKLSIAYDSDMQSDFDDLRFTKEDGETLIDAWLEDKTDGTSADVWVEFPTTPANGETQTYYMYYGKSDAASDWDIGAMAYQFGDDFSGDLSKWSEQSVSASITSGVMHAYPTANYGGLRSTNSVDISSPVMLEARVRMNNAASNEQNGVGFFDRTDATSWYQHPSIFIRQYELTTHKMYAVFDVEGTHYGGNVIHDSTDDNYHRYKIKAEEGTYPTFWFDTDTLTIEHDIDTATYYIWAPKAYNSNSPDEWTECDWIFVRKYAANPPTYSFGSEQSEPGSLSMAVVMHHLKQQRIS